MDRDLLAELTAPPAPTFHNFRAEHAVFLDDVNLAQCRFLGEITFQDAAFHGEAVFDEARFESLANFARARFARRASFRVARFLRDAEFGAAAFDETVYFAGAAFGWSASFPAVSFRGDAYFSGAEFSGVAWFAASSFGGSASFPQAKFATDVTFDRCKFSKDADFAGSEFSGLAVYTDTAFATGVSFSRSHFAREIRLNKAEIAQLADFDAARFEGPVRLEHMMVRGKTRFADAYFADHVTATGAAFKGGLWLSSARLAHVPDLGPMDAGERLVLDRANVDRRVRVQVRADRMSAVDTRFADGADLRVNDAEVVLDGAMFGEPSSVNGVWDGTGTRSTRVLSLRRVDVANLSLVEVDLGACLFEGTHNLDKIHIEGTRPFGQSPPGRRWARRQTLAEEHRWRVITGSRSWDLDSSRPPAWVGDHTGHTPSVVTPGRIATLYRALRKANEDAKNEPGATDFYYGEMEMRRHAWETSLAERLILHAYWFLSGYGLRAWRAVTLLLLLLVTHGALFASFGFSPPSGYLRGLLYALDTMLLFPDRDVVLTTAGHVFRATLRILGPLLLGLALLAIRNRIKR